ncbi:MAG: hypothetical protein H6Q90_6316, partial [Deltaproteobacteria bacterium]|nr:hypothetical protein [Deltaproteobacteria bacterium]
IFEPVKPHVPDVVEQAPVVNSPSRLPLYVGGGATIALAGVATVTGLLAVSQHGTFTAGDSSASERADAKSNGQLLARFTDGALLGAVVAGGFTTYWYLFKYKPGHKKPAETKPRGGLDLTRRSGSPASIAAKVTVAPWVQPGTATIGGFCFAGRF